MKFPTWDEFRAGLNPDLILPIEDLSITVRYPRIHLDEPGYALIANTLRAEFMEILRQDRSLPVSALKVSVAETPIGFTGDTSRAFASLTYESPVYDFSLLVGPEAIQLRKIRTTLENVVRTVPILADMMTRIFRSAESAVGDVEPPPQRRPALIDLLGLQEYIYQMEFRFHHQLTLGTRLTNTVDEVRNTTLFQKLTKSELPSGQHAGREAPFLALQPEAIKRGDFTVNFEKSINDVIRSLWITYEGPWNITQRDFDLSLRYRVGEGSSPFALGDLADFHTPIVLFYRDMMLTRFVADLLHDIRIAGRR